MKTREIAARLMEAAARYPDALASGDEYDEANRAEFRFDSLLIRCVATAPAIRAVADKYRRSKAFHSSGWHRPSKAALIRRPADAAAFLALEADHEEELSQAA